MIPSLPHACVHDYIVSKEDSCLALVKYIISASALSWSEGTEWACVTSRSRLFHSSHGIFPDVAQTPCVNTLRGQRMMGEIEAIVLLENADRDRKRKVH